MDKLTEEQWLARCRTVYRMGLARPEVLTLIERFHDAAMRLENSIAVDSNVEYIAQEALEAALKHENQHTSQMRHVQWAVEAEVARYQENAKWFSGGAVPTLANDKDAYDGIRLLAVLRHPCQICATDSSQWHTRSAFCPHKKEGQ